MELTELFQFQKHLEDTMTGVLSEICEFVYRSRTIETNQTPRLSVKAYVGAQFQNQKLAIPMPPGWIYSSYSGRIETTVTTNRTSESKSGAHDELLGLTRLRHHQFYVDAWQQQQQTIGNILPILIFDIRPDEGDDDVDDVGDLDNTTMTHSILFCINKPALNYN